MRSSILFRLLIVIMLVLTVLAVFQYFNVENLFPLMVRSTPIYRGWPSPTPINRTAATITVNGTQRGYSTCYIGAVEGSSRFNIADLQDLGINTYHLYGGMSRWEAQDDDGIYGSPTIDQIKANPNVINWKWWDTIMTNPPGGSDYWWDPKGPRWHGNARTLFSALKAAHIRTLISLRNRDDQGKPRWAPNPPVTNADWNEWWEHVFATVYWLNVRNDYQVNDFEISSEPNISSQGWRGTEAQYFTFARYTYDAISYVYRTYLPGRVYHVYAPATSLGRSGGKWPKDALNNISSDFDSMAFHLYDSNISNYVEQVHGWLDQAGYPNDPIWLTEWGSYTNQYDSVPFGITLINNLIYGSRPGNDYVYGSQIFSLYDFDTHPDGLISYNGVRRADYYAMRMGIRALQGCRPTYQSTTSSSSLLAITTRDTAGNTYLLVTNQDNVTWYDVDADLSSLMIGGSGVGAVGTGAVGAGVEQGRDGELASARQFDARHMDTVVGSTMLKNGHVTFTIPANGAILLEFAGNAML